MYRVVVDAVLSFYLLNKLKLRVNYFRILLLYSLTVLYLGKRYFKLVRTRYESLSLVLAYRLPTPRT